jgi:hypothetical protein
MNRILENFRAGVRAAVHKAHKAAGEPFAIFAERPRRAYKRPSYKALYEEQKQRADALEESLIALQRELESPEVQVVRKVRLMEVADESQ